MKVADLIRKSQTGPELIEASYTISKFDVDKRLVTGQVYAPNTIDAHGHFVTSEELQNIAHKFMVDGLQTSIDVQHDNKVIDAVIVESYIAKDNDPDFEPGSWVATTKINDEIVWNMVKNGELNGYSFEILTYRDDVIVDVEFNTWYYGFTDPNPYDNHTHPFMVRMDAEGNIAWGMTGLGSDGSPAHPIKKSSVTERIDGHSHRVHFR